MQAIKPVISGWDETSTASDTCRILRSLGLDLTLDNMAAVSPWRLKYPHAPNIAGKREGVQLHYKEILGFCRTRLRERLDYLLIEGVGGVMSPITDDKTCLDLIRDLGVDVLLVTGSHLGSISHTLTALSALGDARVKVVLTLKNADSPHCSDVADYINVYSGKEVYIQSHVSLQGNAADLWSLTSAGIIDFIGSA